MSIIHYFTTLSNTFFEMIGKNSYWHCNLIMYNVTMIVERFNYCGNRKSPVRVGQCWPVKMTLQFLTLPPPAIGKGEMKRCCNPDGVVARATPKGGRNEIFWGHFLGSHYFINDVAGYHTDDRSDMKTIDKVLLIVTIIFLLVWAEYLEIIWIAKNNGKS